MSCFINGRWQALQSHSDDKAMLASKLFINMTAVQKTQAQYWAEYWRGISRENPLKEVYLEV
jgi:hypothetical protein